MVKKFTRKIHNYMRLALALISLQNWSDILGWINDIFETLMNSIVYVTVIGVNCTSDESTLGMRQTSKCDFIETFPHDSISQVRNLIGHISYICKNLYLVNYTQTNYCPNTLNLMWMWIRELLDPICIAQRLGNLFSTLKTNSIYNFFQIG